MTHAIRAIAAALLAAVLMGHAMPAQATMKPSGVGSKFGLHATEVAKAGPCKNVRRKSNGGQYALSGLACDLRGQRINILTFGSKASESRWLTLACTGLPDQWVMIGYGFVITARDGNEKAARVGERVYGGDAYLCSDVTDGRSSATT